MNQKQLLMVIFTGLLTTIGWVAEVTAESFRYDTYQVISQRNMFSRNRRPALPMDSPERSSRRQPVVLSLYVLKGVAVNGPQKVAFIEDEVSGVPIKGQIGREILNGTIKDIKFNHVILEDNGQIKQIKIGDTFGKTESLIEIPDETEDASSSEQESENNEPLGDNEDTPSEESDILKKLLEKRKGELGT